MDQAPVILADRGKSDCSPLWGLPCGVEPRRIDGVGFRAHHRGDAAPLVRARLAALGGWMLLRPLLYLLLVLLAAPADGRAQEAFFAPVFVTHLETQPLPPLKPAEHEAASSRASAEMFAVAKQLRKQHGDKTSAWPPDVSDVLYDALDAHTLAVARRDYQPPETRLGLAGSVEDSGRRRPSPPRSRPGPGARAGPRGRATLGRLERRPGPREESFRHGPPDREHG